MNKNISVGTDIVGSHISCAANFNRSLSITLGTGFGSAFIRNHIPIVDGPELPKLGCIYHLPFKDGDQFNTLTC